MLSWTQKYLINNFINKYKKTVLQNIFFWVLHKNKSHTCFVNFFCWPFVKELNNWSFAQSSFLGDRDNMQFPRDLDLIQSTTLESTLSLKTPPRVLTLNERPIDFLEMEHLRSTSQPSEEVSGTDQI